jgi:hypothetical protein
MHLPVTPAMAKAYQDILVQEAQGKVSAGTAKAARPRLRDRLLVGTGDWLITTGQRLRQRARPAVHALPDPCAPVAGKASV